MTRRLQFLFTRASLLFSSLSFSPRKIVADKSLYGRQNYEEEILYLEGKKIDDIMKKSRSDRNIGFRFLLPRLKLSSAHDARVIDKDTK